MTGGRDHPEIHALALLTAEHEKLPSVGARARW